jgi:NAD(P) transhydrogenase subunit alpha
MSPTMIAIYVFVLSCFIGYHVIWGVTPALHTPLMAVTNAISAIVVVGAILVAGGGSSSGTPGLIEIVGFFAVFLASINIFGGFVVTNRMLAMFKKKKPEPAKAAAAKGGHA